MIASSDIIASLVVAGLYAALFIAAEIWRRKGTPEVESTRKMVHFGGGIVALSFPYIFQSHWPIFIMAVLFMLFLVVARRSSLLQSVQNVERSSIGEIVYPIAIYLTFLLDSLDGRFQYYAIAVLVLAVADAAAGIIGKARGHVEYRVNGDRKSLEGSAAFFVITFLIIVVALGIAGEMPIVEILSVALLASLLLTILEAVSPRGFDNLTIPIGAWCVLGGITQFAWEYLLSGFFILSLATVSLSLVMARRHPDLPASILLIGIFDRQMRILRVSTKPKPADRLDTPVKKHDDTENKSRHTDA